MPPRIGYGIQDFYSTALTYGLARNNAFRIESITSQTNEPSGPLQLFTGPQTPGQLFNSANDDLLIFTRDGSLPSRRISTGKVFFKSFEFNVPLDASYPENTSWRVSFYCDKGYILRKLLELWSVGTFDEHTQAGGPVWTTCDIELKLINYYSKESTSAETQDDPSNMPGRRFKLVGCYPVNIGQISYDNTNSGSIVTMDATLAFQYIITDPD